MGKLITTEEFVSSAIKIHGNTYNYSLVTYINSKVKVKIICNNHGIFEQTPNCHVIHEHGCAKCSNHNPTKLSIGKFITNAIKIHGNTYDYSLSEYKGNKKKVKIICKKHGIFEQSPNNHVSKKQVCPKCSTKFKDTELFISQSINIHNERYDYSLVKYEGSFKKVKIICNYHNKIFEQRPSSHLEGTGCPHCNESKGEREISIVLDNLDIKYIKEFKFNGCKYKWQLPFDFYIPELNLCIEYQGQMHYIPVKYFGGQKQLNNQIRNDSIKRKFCIENKINLIEIKYDEKVEEKLNFLYEKEG